MGDSETEKIKAIIGNLLRKVDNDPSVKSVISAFDPFASKSSNCKSLNCPKYSVEILEKCAVFLGIKLADKDNFNFQAIYETFTIYSVGLKFDGLVTG